MIEDLKAEIERVLLAGGMSEESTAELAFMLSLHYPDHTRLLLDYVPGAPLEEVPPTVE